MLVDVHAHLDDKWFSEDLDEVIERAEKAGIIAIIQNSLNHKTNEVSLSLSKKYKIIRPAFGIYPSEINEDVEKVCEFIRQHKKEVASIGEVGLDGTYPDMDGQKKVFSAMIAIAKELDKPISVHSRKAEQETLYELEKQDAHKVHLHCFIGSMALVKQAVKLGYSFSIPLTILKSSHFQEMAKIIPTTQLLTETDSPYLGIERGKRNEPSNIPLIVKKMAEIKGLELEEMQKILFINYKRLFG
ncbi:MAG TPA: TatD family hydrolase [Candidatus Nanoarchaeia archaeon]|uniref:TatD family hydrolase n=1 Tax=Candidatus Iainarchaeum sp. TaxID=3101447 RepID=A0A8T4KUS0_9ARCH|nr:TatD family hydrolase [Candidatus Diapherotrites archaeon]HLD18398.1 TatD family hydrolase [Candidatus Nanoarchaeia archaeon]